MQTETEQLLVRFTLREDALLAQVTERGLALPERLHNWRFWIGNSAIYLNELSDFVQAYDQKAL